MFWFRYIYLNIIHMLMIPKDISLARTFPLNFSAVYHWLPTQYFRYQIDIWKLTCPFSYSSKPTLSSAILIPVIISFIFPVRQVAKLEIMFESSLFLTPQILLIGKSCLILPYLTTYYSSGNYQNLHYAKSLLIFLSLPFTSTTCFYTIQKSFLLSYKLDCINFS